ncbi:MAG: nickel ABC transporter permease [Dehalococcoidia bacterium]|nr:Glutathione transport system permease protein GsiC [Chloroflexota bacterium]MBT9161864.1 Glutathione transport system permease protein GsiC [Chloroflexota bacterium]
MLTYIIRRIGVMVFILLGVSVITFSMMHFVPGDPAEVIAIERYGEEVTAETIEHVRRELGLDQPVYIQYFRWLTNVLQGDLGYSARTDRPVLDEILTRLPATIQLALAGMLVSLIIAIPVGIISATKQYSIVDNVSMFGALLGVSMPNFWLGLLLILLFSVHLGWLPVFGRGGIEHLILPAITLGTGMAAITTRLMRSSMLEVLMQNYIRTARAKGLTEKLVIGKHALKNAVIPVVTIVGLQFAHLLEGAVIVETIFAWPGIGRLMVGSIFARDFAVVQGCVLFFALIFVLSNLIVDISYAYLDPRIRYARRRV